MLLLIRAVGVDESAPELCRRATLGCEVIGQALGVVHYSRQKYSFWRSYFVISYHHLLQRLAVCSNMAH